MAVGGGGFGERRQGGEVGRRRFLALAAMATAPVLVPGVALAGLRVWLERKRALSFYNLHTGESLKTVYFERGKYVGGALGEIDYILRDFRQNAIKPIEPRLLDLLSALGERLYTTEPFYVISGYRTPKTNAMLREHGAGVAAHSLHIDGRAIDIRVPGRGLSTLRRAAASLRAGGVGYYPHSDFVHVDTGRVRYW
jgi:uncharacterized protein YcbK (DUF882 family)